MSSAEDIPGCCRDSCTGLYSIYKNEKQYEFDSCNFFAKEPRKLQVYICRIKERQHVISKELDTLITGTKSGRRVGNKIEFPVTSLIPQPEVCPQHIGMFPMRSENLTCQQRLAVGMNDGKRRRMPIGCLGVPGASEGFIDKNQVTVDCENLPDCLKVNYIPRSKPRAYFQGDPNAAKIRRGKREISDADQTKEDLNAEKTDDEGIIHRGKREISDADQTEEDPNEDKTEEDSNADKTEENPEKTAEDSNVDQTGISDTAKSEEDPNADKTEDPNADKTEEDPNADETEDDLNAEKTDGEAIIRRRKREILDAEKIEDDLDPIKYDLMPTEDDLSQIEDDLAQRDKWGTKTSVSRSIAKSKEDFDSKKSEDFDLKKSKEDVDSKKSKDSDSKKSKDSDSKKSEDSDSKKSENSGAKKSEGDPDAKKSEEDPDAKKSEDSKTAVDDEDVGICKFDAKRTGSFKPVYREVCCTDLINVNNRIKCLQKMCKFLNYELKKMQKLFDNLGKARCDQFRPVTNEDIARYGAEMDARLDQRLALVDTIERYY